MKKYLTIILFLGIYTSCSKPESTSPDPLFEAPIITGYKLIDIYGLPMGVVGSPNVKAEVTSGGILYRMSVYPIPAINFIALYIDAPKDGTVRQIWVKRAQTNGTFSDDFNFGILNMNASGNMFDTTITENQLSITGTRFPKGYYRMYVSVSGHTLYENIVINN